jgi:holliday junction DNA helicase RuvA
MIGQLTGKIINSGSSPVIIDVSGVGYQVYIGPLLLSKLKNNSELTLYIHTHVRDDAFELYGFFTNDDLLIFNYLLSVSGIGPKTALLVTDRGYEKIKKAIITSDLEFFTTIPRLGKKNAQKIIIELKSKIGSTTPLNLNDQEDSETKDILNALTSMGFDKREIIPAINKISENQKTIEEKIRFLLKILKK